MNKLVTILIIIIIILYITRKRDKIKDKSLWKFDIDLSGATVSSHPSREWKRYPSSKLTGEYQTGKYAGVDSLGECMNICDGDVQRKLGSRSGTFDTEYNTCTCSRSQGTEKVLDESLISFIEN